MLVSVSEIPSEKLADPETSAPGPAHVGDTPRPLLVPPAEVGPESVKTPQLVSSTNARGAAVAGRDTRLKRITFRTSAVVKAVVVVRMTRNASCEEKQDHRTANI